MSAVENLTKWFDELPSPEKINVVQFLYGGKALLHEGMYMGPRPGSVNKGLFIGPAPSSSMNICSLCGRPL